VIGIPGIFIPAIPAMPPVGIGPAGFGDPTSGGGDPAFGIPAIPPMPFMPPMPPMPLMPPIPAIPVALGNWPFAIEERPDEIPAPAEEAAEAAAVAPAERAEPRPDAALDTALGIAFGLVRAELIADAALDHGVGAALGRVVLAAEAALLATEEIMDEKLVAVARADVTAGRFPLPGLFGATHPLTPGRFTHKLDGAWRRYMGIAFLRWAACVTAGSATGLADTAATERQMARSWVYIVEKLI